MARHIPVMRRAPLIKGFLCGSFLAGSVAVPYGIFIQAALFVVCVLVFIDASCVFGRERHPLSVMSLTALGLVAGLLLAFEGFITGYMLLAFLGLAATYLWDYRKRRKR